MKKLFVFMFALVVLTMSVHSQVATADIYGTVLMKNGAAIPGVGITLTSNVTGTLKATTSSEGNFRFIGLPPGTYQLKFELDGFRTIVQKDVRLEVGKSKILNVEMETSEIKEVIVVTGDAGIIDTRKTNVGVTVSKEMITSLPTGRNAWTIMNLVPGLMTDRVDVGGVEGGQQSGYQTPGASRNDAEWNVDGNIITDQEWPGGTTAYLNMDQYEEIQVSVGSNDIKAQTGGVQLNFVSKRGGNRYSGDFRIQMGEETWEYTPKVPQTMQEAGYNSAGIYRLYNYGVNFGGPIVKDKLWFFISWGINDIHARTESNIDDSTLLRSGIAKIDFQFGNTSGNVNLNFNDKKKWGRSVFGHSVQDYGTLHDQTGPGYIWNGKIRQIWGDLMLEARFVRNDYRWERWPKSGIYNETLDLLEGPDWSRNYYPRTYYDGGMWADQNIRPTTSVGLDGNYFAEGVLGGDHEFRFGAEYLYATATWNWYSVNNRYIYRASQWAQKYPGYYESYGITPMDIMEVESNVKQKYDYKRISFYLQDTVSFGRLTANIGVRFDSEKNKILEAGADELYVNGELVSQVVPEWAPYFQKQYAENIKIPVTWNSISPRVSFTYDIAGDGKNVIKLAAAQYRDPMRMQLNWDGLAGLGDFRGIAVPFDDKNGNKKPDFGEFEPLTPNEIDALYEQNWVTGDFHWYYGIDPADPTKSEMLNRYDEDLTAPKILELLASFEKAITPDLSGKVTYIYRRYSNQVWNRDFWKNPDGTIHLADLGDYSVVDTDPVTGQDLYQRNRPSSSGYLVTNYKDSYQTYWGLSFSVKKRMSKGWMANVAFIIQDWTINWDRLEHADDQTNFSYYSKGVNAAESWGSGLQDVYVNSRWQLKIDAIIQLPFGINLSGIIIAQEGFVIPLHDSEYAGNVFFNKDKKFGDDRLPNLWYANLAIEKSFKISERTSATIALEGYNITNNNTIIKQVLDMGPERGDPLSILRPGHYQVAFRLQF